MIYRFIFSLLILFTIPGCLTVDTKCCDHVATDSITKGLYLERYRTFCAGVFGELTQCYITDSVSFRKNIGSYDEHESFRAKINGDKIEFYNLQSSFISDTVNKKTISKETLWNFHHTNSNCLSTLPVFGINSITCNKDFYPASSYKTDDGYFMTAIQYKCGNDYSNAVFYTDSLHFCIFIGVYVPGSFENNYSIRQRKDSFDLYNVTDIRKIDTIKAQAYLLPDLKKGSLITVCNGNNKK